MQIMLNDTLSRARLRNLPALSGTNRIGCRSHLGVPEVNSVPRLRVYSVLLLRQRTGSSEGGRGKNSGKRSDPTMSSLRWTLIRCLARIPENVVIAVILGTLGVCDIAIAWLLFAR